MLLYYKDAFYILWFHFLYDSNEEYLVIWKENLCDWYQPLAVIYCPLWINGLLSRSQSAYIAVIAGCIEHQISFRIALENLLGTFEEQSSTDVEDYHPQTLFPRQKAGNEVWHEKIKSDTFDAGLLWLKPWILSRKKWLNFFYCLPLSFLPFKAD